MGFDAFKVSESAPPVSTTGAVTPVVQAASPVEPSPSVAPQEERELAPEEQYVTSVTPSGIEVYYSWAPRRHYKLADPGTPDMAWREVPSVTTVLGVLDKSGPLTWWAQRIGVEGFQALARKGVVKVGGDGTIWAEDGLEIQSTDVVSLLTEHKLSVNHVKDSAADRGVNVHGALERWVEDRFIPEPAGWPEHERGYISGLCEFLAAVNAGAGDVAAELMVGSLKHSYAGRFDLVLTLSKPVEVVTKTYPKRKPKIEEIPAGRYLLDLKTSKGIYNTHYLQLEAYEAAAVECGYQSTDHRGVIHVTADGRYELALNKDWTFEDFLAVRQCYQVMNERSVIQALRDELGAKEVA